MKPMSSRLAAWQVIAAVLDDQQTLDVALGHTLPQLADTRDRAQAQKLAYTVLRWKGSLDWFITQLLNHPLKKRDRDIQHLLRLGVAQLWPESLAGYAAVNETVALTRVLDKPWASGLVNGVLRNYQRRKAELIAAFESDPIARLSHPGWLLEQLQSDWPDDWQSIVEANNHNPPLWLRINEARLTAADYHQQLLDHGIDFYRCDYAPAAVAIDPPRPVADIPGFADGLVSVQDCAAQLAAGLIAPATGDIILDACAAPGGKAAHMLESAPGPVDLLALDKSPARMEKVQHNLERLGLGCQLKVADAGCLDDWWDGQLFDKILLDAPCSASGIIRRHPDIKWLREASHIEELTAIQKRLLESIWLTLKPGGKLVYATCSVLSCENHEQIDCFISRHDDARARAVQAPWGTLRGAGRQLMPITGQGDGFFYAVLEKHT